MSDIIKSILEISDIQALKPNFNAIKILNRQECESTHTLIFDKEWNTLKIITTNNFPEELQKITKALEQKWLQTNISYTSKDWF